MAAELRKKGNWVKSLFLAPIAIWKSFWRWYSGLYRNSRWYKKALVGFISFIIVSIVYFIMVDVNFLWLFGKSPSLSAIHNPEQPEASEIYTADGKLIGKYFRENRSPVTYDEISPKLIKTLITTEDERFYHHFGIDIQGLFSATKDMMHGEARGASTITQQLVKNMFKVRSQYSTGLLGKIPGLKIIIMKSKEWVSAVKIEMFYSKQEILTMYLNTVDFGSNAYGIKTAAQTYFRTTPADVTYDQAAVLVGLLKATSYYNPRMNPKNSLRRRNVVLENLCNHLIITRQECDSLKDLPIKLNYAVATNYDGKAQYFREAVANYLSKWCKDNDIDLYSAGLKIYTTLDSRMQQYAEDAADRQMRVIQKNFNSHWGSQNPWRDKRGVEIPNFIEDLSKRTVAYKMLKEKFAANEDSINYYLNKPHRLKVFDYKLGLRDTTISTMDSIRYMERFMHCGFVALEPESGYVKAWVGDIGFQAWKYDKVTAKRQPGSTFKLFVYTEAMNQGMSPCDTRQDRFISLSVAGKGKNVVWTPHNANGGATGQYYSLKSAFAQSVNTIAVQLGQEVGIKNVARTAHRMGIKTPLEETPALALGASDVSLLELVNAYTTVINGGKSHDPVMVTKIVDKNDRVIYEYAGMPKQAIPYETAFLMTELLKGGLTEPGGTSRALWGYDVMRFNTDFGGKTGTSSNHSDAWYVGCTPHLVGGAWVGGEHRSIHFRTGQLGQGSRTALPIFAYFMEKVLKDPNLKEYRAKFPLQPKTKIERDYKCRGVVYSNDSDSLSIEADSLSINSEDEVDLDDLEKPSEPEHKSEITESEYIEF